MNTEDVKPGYTHLRLEHSSDPIFFKKCVQFGYKHFLSSTLWKQHFVVRMLVSKYYIIHGPCISDINEYIEYTECLHCKTWISHAEKWIKRSNNSYMS